MKEAGVEGCVKVQRGVREDRLGDQTYRGSESRFTYLQSNPVTNYLTCQLKTSSFARSILNIHLFTGHRVALSERAPSTIAPCRRA